MFLNHKTILKFFLILLPFFGYGQTSEVIKLTGSFAVSDAGSATYSVPITLPPGLGGMKPDLSVNYNSNGGNGILGVGWAFTGMSVISRGSRTLEQDNAVTGIKFDRNDVYALDGERLVLWKDDVTYGSDGAEYGTESNSFMKIVSIGSSGEGPDHFVVFTKTGLKLTFGGNDNSRVFVPGTKTVLYYLVNRIEELSSTGNGNYITFTYEKDEANASYRPLSIRYTQNDNLAPGSNTGLTDVKFGYEDRNDVEVAYFNGIKVSISKRLSSLSIEQNNEIKEIYGFNYIEYGSKKSSLLESIRHCIASSGQCSDLLTFQWDTTTTQLEFYEIKTPIPTSAIKGNKKEIHTQDMNNDGLNDIIIVNRAGANNTVSVEFYLNKGEANFTKINTNLASATENSNFNFLDVNSDGFIDIVVTHIEGNIVWYINPKNIDFSGTNEFKSVPNPVSISDFKNTNFRKQYFFIDYNGDARQDMIIFDPEALPTSDYIALYINLSDKDNLFKMVKSGEDFNIPDHIVKNFFFVPVDFNNDGLTDLLAYSRDEKSGDNRIYENVTYIGEGFEESNKKFDNKWFNVYPDTWEDYGLNTNKQRSYNGQEYRINNSESKENVLTPKFFGQRNPLFTDLNGDGLPDLVISKTHNHFYEYNQLNARSIQVEKVYTFINKGDFTFTSPKIISSPVNSISDQIENPKIPLNSSPADVCFLGFFNTALGYNNVGQFWTRYTDNKHIHWEHPRYYIDLNADGKSELIVRYDNQAVMISPKASYQELICGDISEYFSYNKDHQISFGRFYRFGTDIFIYNTLTGANSIQKNMADGKAPVITRFYGQLGGDIQVTYSTLNDNDVYVQGKTRSYPDIDFSSSGLIVKNFQKELNYQKITNISYQYFDGVVNLRGRGHRGFKKIVITDEVQGFKTIKEFEENSRFIAANLKSQRSYTKNGTLISEEIHKNVQWETRSDGSGGIFVPYAAGNFQDQIFTPYPAESISRSYDHDGTLLVENKSRVYMDVFGNTIYQVFEHGDGCIDSIYNRYSNDWNQWFIGRLLNSKVYKNCPGSPTLIRESEFEYDPLTGLLTKEILEPNQDDRIRTVKTYERDGYGNITKTTEMAWNGSQVIMRTKSAKFDATGRFQIETTNQLGHKVSIKTDPYRGLPIESVDENGLVTKMNYNSFGILRDIQYPDGTTKMINSKDVIIQIGFNTYRSFEFSTSGSSSPLSVTKMDEVGREHTSISTLFDGSIAEKYTEYNDENRVRSVQFPYGYEEYIYDVGGRITNKRQLGNNNNILEENYSYTGLSMTVTNPLQQTMTKIKDVRQRLLKSIDNAGNKVTYKYNTEGQMEEVVVGDDEYIITYEYDLRGRMIAMNDPVLGREEYTYDGFGNLLRKKDGKGNVVSYTYDNLNRILSINQSEGIVNYTYDQGIKAIGKLSKITYPNYESNFVYDNVGRLSQKSIVIQGKTYNYKYHYNTIGKIDRVEHPAGIILKYTYNNQFYLTKITNNQNGKLLWEIKNTDRENRVLEEVFGNGVTSTYEYDIQDNLTRVRATKSNNTIYDLQYEYNSINLKTAKIDLKNNITETFAYDELNRLTEVVTTGQINEVLTMSYDKWGNIKTKSDLGTYYYNKNIPTLLERIDFTNKDCNLPSSNFDYEYTSFNKISKITGDSVRLEITYGPDNQRLLQRTFIHNQLHESKTYVDGDYEILNLKGVETKRATLTGTTGSTVIYEITGVQTGNYNFLHKDEQGTVVAISDDGGTVQYTYRYDVWGKRKVYGQIDTLFGGTYRGYTGHEHIAMLDLINMNGRIYDPYMARFISPDPYIQDISYFQNFNRYSYVFNNPVNLTDPSGYFSLRKITQSVTNNVSKTIGRIGNGISNISNGHIRDGLKQFGQVYLDNLFKWSGYREIDRHGRKAFGDETWNEIVVAAITIVVSYVTSPAGGAKAATLTSTILSGVAAGAAGGAAGAHLAGAGTNDMLKASFRAAVISGLNAGLTYGVKLGIENDGLGLQNTYMGEGLRAIGHGAVQGVMTELQGGKFYSGFYAGFVSTIASHTNGFYRDKNLPHRVFAASMVGGAISSITGGKFASGAVSGAFQELYNNSNNSGNEDDILEKIKNWHDREGGMSHKSGNSFDVSVSPGICYTFVCVSGDPLSGQWSISAAAYSGVGGGIDLNFAGSRATSFSIYGGIGIGLGKYTGANASMGYDFGTKKPFVQGGGGVGIGVLVKKMPK